MLFELTICKQVSCGGAFFHDLNVETFIPHSVIFLVTCWLSIGLGWLNSQRSEARNGQQCVIQCLLWNMHMVSYHLFVVIISIIVDSGMYSIVQFTSPVLEGSYNYAIRCQWRTLEEFVIPPATKLGGVYWIQPVCQSVCPSVRLSVCLSVCLSVR